jgi:hypothetical protein
VEDKLRGEEEVLVGEITYLIEEVINLSGNDLC